MWRFLCTVCICLQYMFLCSVPSVDSAYVFCQNLVAGAGGGMSVVASVYETGMKERLWFETLSCYQRPQHTHTHTTSWRSNQFHSDDGGCSASDANHTDSFWAHAADGDMKIGAVALATEGGNAFWEEHLVIFFNPLQLEIGTLLLNCGCHSYQRGAL